MLPIAFQSLVMAAVGAGDSAMLGFVENLFLSAPVSGTIQNTVPKII